MHTIRVIKILKEEYKNRWGTFSLLANILDENNGKELDYWVHANHHVHSYLYEKITTGYKNLNLKGFIISLDINIKIIKSLNIYKDLEIAKFRERGDFVFWDIDHKNIYDIIFWTLKDQLYGYLRQKDEAYVNLDTYFLPPMGEVNNDIEKIYEKIKGLYMSRSYSIEKY